MKKIFLTAEWRKLAMANYIIDPTILQKYVPPHTELDFYNGNCYVSLIGFMFLNTKIKGFKIPFHINFEEVNLRFYVRYKEGNEWRRGAVFISEVVSKPMISLVANTLFHEHYTTLKTKHSWETKNNKLHISYQWKKKEWCKFALEAEFEAQPFLQGSEEQFITEHYWGYTTAGKQTTSEYGVEHPSWEIYKVNNHQIEVDFEDMYGADFAFLNQEKPNSVFLAEGSEVLIRDGRKI
ncbi:YqjF family protein [Pedobacter cryophilus]|uniref:DUF2071 domain-containing protein n=1 Tax=Pedobacter cryophilus TaxID=2571271 RepID=A0A4U1C718_9SPHI|nr:DUF2071 domain-containing protein [Pedobacter cryophilus]TKC00444.1 DUF2071 domain-containing protein [Pedobacter cryophilus]